MKLETYENQRLRKEFENIQKLASDQNLTPYLKINFQDRISRKTIDILHPAPPSKYPEVYFIKYSMDMYIGENKLEKNWIGNFKIVLTKDVFDSKKIPSHQFTYQKQPYNQHVSKSWSNGICTGHIWDLAKHYGVWYFIIGLGGILNLEKEWLANNSGHLNLAAHKFWKRKRNMEPTNPINWPYGLTLNKNEELQFGVSENEPKGNETSILFGEKNRSESASIVFGDSKQENFNVKF